MDLYMGVRQWSEQAVLPFLSDSILRLFYFTPCCHVDVNPWTRKPQKNYTKEDSNIQETKTFFPLYFLGSTNIQWVREFSLNTIEIVEFPSQGV